MSTLPQLISPLKIFLDIAEQNLMLDALQNPLVQGFTTNPSLMRKSGVQNYKDFSKNLLTKIKKPISFEVFADDFDSMHIQALEISNWGTQVYVKIPITNTLGQSSVPLIQTLSHQGIKLNVTAVFTVKQVLEIALALKNGAPSIISVFAGRIADTGVDPMPIMKSASEICLATDPNIELLWASSRESLNVMQAKQTGCNIITVMPEILKKLHLFNKSLEEMSLDTVQVFKKDAEAAGFSL
ncbi:MAG: transaldolase [Deltaproteobacteria bacterium]|nr:transaldolase [Deltaproteobacteria bacterium]